MISIRGAIVIDRNTKQDIINGTLHLLEKIILANDLRTEDFISITFSATKDLTAAYPAIAARNLNILNASLLCVQEMYVEGSLEMCIRILAYVNKSCHQNEVKHIYLNGAEVLRPDLSRKDIG